MDDRISVQRSIRRRLLRWYDRCRRDLPWRRRAGDPYAQWVAETMLQQTRVETVLRYYDRFLSAFPTIESLAFADSGDVLGLWQGMGYYRRVLHLQRACRELVERGEGIPDSAAGLRALPGIGEYTAAALASIAFGRPAAAVDGNVARVIARLFCVQDDVTLPLGRKRISELANELLDKKRPGAFNQAWMDLGSLVCTPRDPKCGECPLSDACGAFRAGLTDDLPKRAGARSGQVSSVWQAVVVFRRNGRMLVHQRETGGLWSGLWEFPGVTMRKPREHAIARVAEAEGAVVKEQAKHLGSVRHRLTHRDLRLEVFAVEADTNGKAPCTLTHRWVTAAQFQRLPVSTAHRKVHAVTAEVAEDRRKPSAAGRQ